MKANIYINRHIVAANKKATKETGILVDDPAISINTYKGVIYTKEITFADGSRLIQDAANARCSGAKIWLETKFDTLKIGGLPAHRSMIGKTIDNSNRNIIPLAA